MNERKTITRKQLRLLTGCPGYTISYLYDCGRLPIIKESKGKGYPVLFDPKAIDVIEDHINNEIQK